MEITVIRANKKIRISEIINQSPFPRIDYFDGGISSKCENVVEIAFYRNYFFGMMIWKFFDRIYAIIIPNSQGAFLMA